MALVAVTPVRLLVSLKSKVIDASAAGTLDIKITLSEIRRVIMYNLSESILKASQSGSYALSNCLPGVDVTTAPVVLFTT